ncbi:MAG TPA: glycosyltransferase, partial [Ramlibacter sp.]|nr:glycosyltransferase [Ramlibacter sp.]
MTPLPEQVAGVVVAYHPDLPALGKLLRAARPQLAALVVIDNTPAAAVAPIPAIAGVEHVSRGFNLGLAAGLNQGCEWARARGARYVLMFD